LYSATEGAVEPEHEAEFDDFFASAYPAIVRSAALVVGDQEVARELAQDAFVKALLHWRRVRTYEYPQAWVRKVVFRMALRAKRTVVQHEQVPPPVVDDLADVDLMRAIGALPPMQRAAIALHYLDDLPVEEVANTLGCAPSTARVHLHRGRARLAELLHEEHDDVAH
jgi:RNA polymerase sigma-70 factor (ECF subfamily)